MEHFRHKDGCDMHEQICIKVLRKSWLGLQINGFALLVTQ